MAPTNRERMTRGFDLLSEGLYDFVDGTLTQTDGPDWDDAWSRNESQWFLRTTLLFN